MSEQNAEGLSQIEADMMRYRESLAKSRAAVARAREVIREGEKLKERLGINTHQAKARLIETGFRSAPGKGSVLKPKKRRMAI